MIPIKLLIALLIFVSSGAVLNAEAAPIISKESGIVNLSAIKRQIVEYHDSGQWDKDIAEVVGQAKTFLQQQLQTGGKLALVLDIDETAMTKYQQFREADFALLATLIHQWYIEQNGEAIQPILELYRFAINQGCAVFFVSGREERFREVTESLLKKLGYTTWTDVILRPDDDPRAASVFKTAARTKLSGQGYRIIINMGDQLSDLEGGYAERSVQIPNPMYQIIGYK